jgi:cytochrome c556
MRCAKLAVVLLGVGVVSALAQLDPIAARRALMKANEEQTKFGLAMIKGEAPFDLPKAKAIFTSYLDAATKAPNLFPENSKTGGDTVASPKIWEDMAGFKAGFAKLEADAKAALASISDLQSFKTAFAATGKDCGNCHETYRLSRK